MSAIMINSIVPKYVIAKSINSLPNPLDEFLQMKAESSVDSDAEGSVMSMSTNSGGGRKRKLDHLTPEEKLQRKKLKNRVAAQTSRDRKKAKMEDMEHKIATQADEIKTLTETCKALRKERDDMRQQYLKIEKRCNDLEEKLAEQEKHLKQTQLDADIASRFIGSVTNTNGSAVSNTYPLPQGLVAQSIMRNAKSSSESHIAALVKVIALCLLYKTGLKDVTSINLNSLPTACWETLQPTLKTMLQQAMAKQKQKAFQNPLIEAQWEPQPMEGN